MGVIDIQKRQLEWVEPYVVPKGATNVVNAKKFINRITQKFMNDRSFHYLKGKVPGGSSSMNSMIYIRGDKSGYDHWAPLGC